ncbi:ankyrin repeat domain-containing protein [Paenibacillus qinlingensis]|uniref:Ankyrin repeat protein n=1 Tax=Paenibacillus qinlingensis TaxID=1837343 RepID=A0ABU1NSR1_9BACL|nr:ankyrin repeat domain-containing protein [Paenibacillus qinlingensis]MDR6550525.1 ankyrin repeat protein [Paenibacillus qinlingensis]
MSQSLIAAVERGDIEQVQQLLSNGVNLNEQDNRGRTAIMAATHANNPAIVKLLIDAGADIHIKDAMQDNPFLYAGAEGLLSILQLLIEAGANTKLTNRYGGNALIPAAEKGHLENVRVLLTTTDVDVNHINNLGWTALLEVAILTNGGPKYQDITRLLIEHGANVHIADRDGVTALQHAKRNRFTEIEQILRLAGAK